MEEQRIIWLCILYQPVHCAEYVGLCRLAHGILLIVRQDDHIFSRVVKVLIEICRHVFHVVDASS